jgi:2-oxo-4-hydroxy-4-carboxy-5-ureidoimidazoline decarboxylase
VRGRARSEILAIFAARLRGAPAEEEQAALDEIALITRMRLDRLVAGSG